MIASRLLQVIWGVPLLTVRAMLVVMEVYPSLLEGVKTMLGRFLPALGRLVGDCQAQLPGTLATPPLRTELLSAWPKVIVPGLGTRVIKVVERFTVKLTFVVTVLKLLEAVGVKVTGCKLVPDPGLFVGLIHAQVPGTLATPLLRTELLSACPTTMGREVGTLLMTGVALETVTLTVAEPVPAIFDAEIDDVKVPAELGVPEITPVEVLTDNPGGKLLAL